MLMGLKIVYGHLKLMVNYDYDDDDDNNNNNNNNQIHQTCDLSNPAR
jgi:hypothetical protein